jgi:serine/threonine-protein kinase mTOR
MISVLCYDLSLMLFSIMVRAQMLSELEEIIQYKQHADQPERQKTMRTTWMKRYRCRFVRECRLTNSLSRLQGCQPDVEVWARVLQVRSLVLGPDDDPGMWIKFANLCRKSDRMALAEKTINSLLYRGTVTLIRECP